MEKYANHYGWSDITPFEIIKSTAKTITIREMNAERDPNWKPSYEPGGFSVVCTNDDQQKWVITSNEHNPLIKAYLRKDGKYYSKIGMHILSDSPIKYYDYNF